ncbi:MAG: aminotransferase class V-fold PLP-dependent enzyme, partial [Candidatus Uhrbacteria bacterium]|nr:aminotransferase class V-fold PLP-dependent enzyme [Candidatus Uhrbacteria bacterium]
MTPTPTNSPFVRGRAKIVYLDHAATTPMDAAVLKSMQPYFSDVYGNPSSFHTLGMRAKEAVTESRIKIAKLLNAHEDEILFTSGGTESDNMAVLGVPRYWKGTWEKEEGKRDWIPHVITSAIEHHAVLEPLVWLQRRKEIELTIIGVDRYGSIDPKAV